MAGAGRGSQVAKTNSATGGHTMSDEETRIVEHVNGDWEDSQFDERHTPVVRVMGGVNYEEWVRLMTSFELTLEECADGILAQRSGGRS